MTKEESWFWLTNLKGLYRNNIKSLLEAFGEPEEIFHAPKDLLLAKGKITPGQAASIIESRNHYRNSYKLEKLRSEGIRFIYYGSEEYPAAFAALEDKPYALYVKGKLPDPDLPTAGIIGARLCSGYGREMTMRYAQALAGNGVQIISGMAQGVDTCASKGAIEAGGKTFVVLGSGLDVIYPRQNMELYYQIILTGGGVISEYPMGTAPVGWQFPHRNRLISALSDKLLVMEAKKQSGTLSTVAYALEQGKDVYALPGRVTDPLSEGCNQMLADGAGVLIDPSYLLQEYFGSGRCTYQPSRKNRMPYADPDSAKGKICQILDYEPKMVQDIAALSGVGIADTARTLTELEIGGFCREISKDYYALC